MARENLVSLLGPIMTITRKIGADGTPIRTVFSMVTCTRRQSNIDKGYDSTYNFIVVPVVTKNSKIMEKLQDLEKNDVVFIKGVLCTRRMTHRCVCPNCQNIEDRTVNRAYIVPIDLICLKKGIEYNAAREFMLEHSEFSNEINIVGYLCADPKRKQNDNVQTPLEYQIAVNRLFRIAEDGEEIRTDFPKIVSYGEASFMDEEVLHKGSQVMIDGFMRTSSFTIYYRCQNCDTKYPEKNQLMEIIPYNIEYLRNCDIPEEEIE